MQNSMIALAIVVALILIGYLLISRAFTVVKVPLLTSSVRPGHVDAEILSSGWTAGELNKIFVDFSGAYLSQNQSGAAASPIALKAGEPDAAGIIRTPVNLTPEMLYYLVNYMNYPRGFDLKSRSIAVVARASLTPEFAAPSDAGANAQIFVPDNDVEYDLVHLWIENGPSYQISFANLKWVPIPDCVMPPSVSALSSR